jgi:DNA-binding CsgD family transcriptional regulator/tetratricopeptide (TPR) repeat protein
VARDLLERDAELATLEALIGGASGWGRLLAIEGPPGIGKSALIREAQSRAQQAGVEALGARGSELEATFSFGVVRQLFEPLLAQLAEEERDELLAGAAEFATPVFEPAQLAAEATRDVSLAMLHGLYWLTANVAASRPVLLTVDDLHWCDPPSLRWLAYLLPRLDGLDLSIVVGLRPAEHGEAPALLSQIISDPRATIVQPAPLSAPATTRLIRETLLPGTDEGFCAACHELTGGNPLLLRELRNAIVAEGVVPSVVNVSRLRELAARAGSRALSARLSRLAPEAARLAQAVAILGEDVDPHHAAALADLDEQAASQAIADLVRVDVLRSERLLGFVHPLVRAAVYETLTPLERDAGHARAARLLAASQAEPERVAAHLLLVSPAAAPEVVTVLREAARRAVTRGAAESAVGYLRRALAEPPATAERADVELELGSAEALVTGAAAVEHLRKAHELTDDPIRRAKVSLALGEQLSWLSPEESANVLQDALDELAGADPELGRILEARLIDAFSDPLLYRAAVRRLRGLRDRPPTGRTLGEKMLLAELAYHDAWAGAPAAAVVPLARRALAGETLLAGEVSPGPMVHACVVLIHADLDDALRISDAALAEAHQRGSMLAFALAKMLSAEALLSRGDLAEAEADGREARDAYESWGATARFPALVAAFLSDALIEQGKIEDAAVALERADVGDPPAETARALLLLSRARLRMLSRDPAGGLEDVLDAGRRFEAVGGRNPAFVAWRSQAALALLELGDRDEARRLAGEELELARTWGAPRALGAALRVAGLIAGGVEGVALLREAVEVLFDSPAKLEHAKARTELGAALRRGNRRAQAREQLRRAVELATICGASLLAARAETELLATGARPRRIALSGVESLTPSERRVAELAAQGPTNREIAQALFVTPKTVEVHLSRVYRKLGINSLSQLAAALVEPTRV